MHYAFVVSNSNKLICVKCTTSLIKTKSFSSRSVVFANYIIICFFESVKVAFFSKYFLLLQLEFTVEMNLQILENIRQLKRQLLPNDRLILFGSQARGDARPDSDWDLLLLLNKPEKEETDEDKSYEFVLMGWKLGVYLSIKLYTENEWKKRKNSPFYENVEQDGFEII